MSSRSSSSRDGQIAKLAEYGKSPYIPYKNSSFWDLPRAQKITITKITNARYGGEIND